MVATTSSGARATVRRSALAVLALLVVATSLPLLARPAAAEQSPDVCTTWWDGGAGTASWHDPGNWDADELPGPDDVACIEARMAGTRGVTYSEAVATRVYALHTDTWFQVTGGELALSQSSAASGVALDGGRLVVDTWLRAADVRQTGGAVAGGGLLDVTGFLAWSGGAQEGPGRTDVKRRPDGEGGVYLQGTGERTLAGGRGLEAAAGVRWTDGGFLHVLDTSYANLGHSTIAGAVAQVKGPGAVRAMGDVFVEDGLLTVDGPFATDTASTVTVTGADGAVALYGGGDLHGDVSLAADTELSFQAGAYTIAHDGSVFGQGDVTLAAEQWGGTNVLVEGAYQVASTDVSTNAWLHAGDAAHLGALSITDGALEVTGTVTAGATTFDGGDIWGSGRLDVQGDLTWGEGRMSGPGYVDVQGTTTLAVEGAARELNDRYLRTVDLDVAAAGTIAFTGADPQLGVTGGFTVVDHDLHLSGAGKVNPGNLTVDEATLTVDPQLNTSPGTQVVVGGDVLGGALLARGGGTQQGHVDATGASLVLGGETTWAPSSAIVADEGDVVVLDTGTVDFGGATQQLGTLVNAGVVRFSAAATAESVENTGSVAIADERSLGVSAGYLQTGDDASTHLETANATLRASGGNVQILGGALDGSGAVEGDLVNAAVVAPVDQLTVVGSYEQRAEGTLTIGVDGAAHDRLDVWGSATLDGTADVQVLGAAPTAAFDILTSEGLTGTFSAETGGASCLRLLYSPTSVSANPMPCAVVLAGTAREDAAEITFPVTLSEPAGQSVEIDFWASSDSATAGEDVSAEAGTVTLAPGQTEGVIRLPLVDDDEVEGDETFLLQLDGLGVVLESSEVVGTIVDDDEPPVEIPELDLREIPASIDVGGVQTLNNTYVGGYHGVVIGDEQWGWVYKISDGTSGYVADTRWITDINRNDHAVVECWYDGSCFRKDKVNTEIPSLAGYGSAPHALNDSDVIVGSLFDGDGKHHAAIWADPGATPSLLPVPAAEHSWAADINTDGMIVGGTRTGTAQTGWVSIPELGVLDITSPDFANVEPRALNDEGAVVGFMWNEDRSLTHAFVWYGDDAVDLGPGGANGIDQKGRVVGWGGNGQDVHGAIWVEEQGFDLNQIAGREGYFIGAAIGINDNGVIAAEAATRGQVVPIVLMPPGQGCKVCMDLHAEVQQFPDPDVWISTGNSTVEGNTVRMRNVLTNNTEETQTVSVTFWVDDQPHGADEHVVTLEPGESTEVQELWETEGQAWSGGLAAGPHQLAVTLAYGDGVPMQRTTMDMQVNPRPVVMVHGMNSDAATWASYQGFLGAAHPGWKGFAVDTMDTSSDPPFTIAKNATKLAAFVDTVQRGQNAWQVDLVGHSMGGLISRYYISELMQDRGGVRPVDRLVMLGTPNAGSPCADLFTTTMTWQLRSDVMANFNAMFTERQGVPFSVAVGDWMPFTCQSLERGDMVVPLSSAAHGIEDTATFDIAHTDMTASHELFLQFVLPRLNGQQASAAAEPTARSAAPETEGSTAAADASLAGPADVGGGVNPQLLTSFTDVVAPGATTGAQFEVPAGTTGIGAVALAGGDVEVQLVRRDTTVAATTGTTSGLPSTYRSAAVEAPAAEWWSVKVVNHGATEVTVPVAVWGAGLPNHLSASAAQVDELGTVHLSATLSGTMPAQVPTRLAADLVPTQGGETLRLDLYDDGQHGDGAAGDLTFGADVPNLPPMGWTVRVATDFPYLQRWTTTSVEVSHGVDDPTVNDAPTAYGSSVAAPRNAVTSLRLTGTDPEGSTLTYEIVQPPVHGKLGGGGGGASFEYAPAEDYMGPDSFTFRVHDGELYSPPATVTIEVGKEPTQLRYIRPIPAETTQGRIMYGVTVQLLDNSLAPIEGAPVEMRFGGQTHTVATGINGFTGTNLDIDVPVGTHVLEVVFPGDAVHAPTVLHQNVYVVQGVSPAPSIEGPIEAEAGYPVNVLIRGNDHDGDTARFELDVDDDGTWDLVHEREPASNGVDYGHTFVVTYPEAFDGQVRARVTDAAGNVAETTEPVHVAPHRPLGALERLVDDRGERLDGSGISADGRYVVHRRTEDAVSGASTPMVVLDRTTGQTEVVSILPDGTTATSQSPRAIISPNGRYVAFVVHVSVGGYLPTEVFLRDREAGTTVPVSVNDAGQLAAWHTGVVSVADDGKVLFASNAENLGTIPPNCGTIGQTVERCTLLWLRDPAAGTTTLVSRDAAGDAVPVASSTNDMTNDGRYVIWGDNHKVWLWDATVGHAVPVGIAAGGGDSNASDIGASNFQLSEDGQRFLFNATGTNIHPDDTDTELDVYLFDRSTGTSSLVSRASDGTKGDRASYESRMSGDGRVVVFSSYATNLVPGDDDETWDVFVRDLDTGTTTRVSEEARDHLQPDGDSHDPQISCDGRWVVFHSDARNLVPGDVNLRRDVFAFDRGAAAARPCDGSTPPPPPNSAPTAEGAAVTTAEDSPVSVALTATDVDGDELTFAVVDGPEHGTLAGEGAALTYTPGADFHGTDQLTFTASDAEATSEPATVTITVDPVNDAPVVELVAGAASVDEGGTVGLDVTATDVDGDPLTTTWRSDAGTITGTGGHVTLRDLDGPATATVTVEVSDGVATTDRSTAVEVANVAPTATAGADVEVEAGQPVTFAGTATDPGPGDTAAGLTARWDLGDGTTADGLTVQHTYADPGTHEVVLTVTDRDGATGRDTVAVTVTEPAPQPSPVPGLVVATTDGPFGFAAASARATDPVSGAPLAGRVVTFVVAGRTVTAPTGADGVARVPATDLRVGRHTVTASIPADGTYDGATATGTVKVTSSVGRVQALALDARGLGGVIVHNDGRRMHGVLGWLSRYGLTASCDITGLGIRPDRRAAWISARTWNGRDVLVYVEDNGGPFAGRDVVRLWVDGVERTSGTGRVLGDVSIR